MAENTESNYPKIINTRIKIRGIKISRLVGQTRINFTKAILIDMKNFHANNFLKSPNFENISRN